MTEWRTTSIGEVLTLQRGFDITRAQQQPGDIPVVSSGGISSYHDTAAATGPGVVIGRKGTLGKTFYLRGDYWPHDTTLWVKDFKGNLPRFVYYFFTQLDVMGLDVGSANPTLNRNHVHPIHVRWPSPRDQESIAAALSALDDKIAINEQVAATGETLAISLTSNEPWPELTMLGKLVRNVRDQVLPEFLESDRVAHYSLPAFDAGQVPEVVPPNSIKSGKLLITEACILLSKLNPSTPRIWHVEPSPELPSLASTEFLVLTPLNDTTPAELWAVCAQPRFSDALMSNATGTSNSHQRVRPADVLATQVVNPRVIAPNVRQHIRILATRSLKARLESVTLRQLRDALLPKLMSGELRVRDAEKVVEDAT